MDDLKTLRKEVDLLDDKIMKLLDERFNINKIIGIIKQEEHIDINDTSREAFILSKINQYKHKERINQVYQTIFQESKKLQGK
jgi:chorismate mutase